MIGRAIVREKRTNPSTNVAATNAASTQRYAPTSYSPDGEGEADAGEGERRRAAERALEQDRKPATSPPRPG